MIQLTAEYLAAGGNRHPSAADWDEKGVLAFGADRNIALWRPQSGDLRGVFHLLAGHTDTVNTVKFLPSRNTLISGSVDKTVRIWSKKEASDDVYSSTQILFNHESSVNCLAVVTGANLFASGSADGTVKIWSLDERNVAILRQSITLTPRFFPLALALSPLAGAPDSYVLAVGGTKEIIQLYVLDRQADANFHLRATLTGHEGWIRSLEFSQENHTLNSDLIMCSASQDKYIRLWRIHQGKELPTVVASADPSLGAFMPGKSLSNKAHRFKANELDFSATFEALLFGHEDWIYSTRWRREGSKLQLLSASADNSLAIWEPDVSTGVWITVARLGEISAEKGSTTATGSTGGFWIGLWAPSGQTVVCLGRTGSWRLWNRDANEDLWIQNVGISGHVQSVTSIAWSKGGDYLLSSSSDQTTRLHAQWKRAGQESWHEMARPQIHGYDLNCIDSLGASQFVSGADEKLLRVFREPKAVATLLDKLCGFRASHLEDMPDAANMPVLGLSNKAIEAISDDDENNNGKTPIGNYQTDREAIDPASIVHKSTLDLAHPPLEDHLSRHTLWPEIEKLYGHGYEISALASSHDGSLVATACKASSLDHAVIRLFETHDWREIRPPLVAHSLTVTRLRFSPDDEYLLSVGRDRQWAVFRRRTDDANISSNPNPPSRHTYTPMGSNPKGHSRMILDAAWAPSSPSSPIFATAGRDKMVRIWGRAGGADAFSCLTTITETDPITAIDFRDTTVDGRAHLGVGTEAGIFKIYSLAIEQKEAGMLVEDGGCVEVHAGHPSLRAITRLAWQPRLQPQSGGQEDFEPIVNKDARFRIAIAGEDGSLRIYRVDSP